MLQDVELETMFFTMKKDKKKYFHKTYSCGKNTNNHVKIDTHLVVFYKSTNLNTAIKSH